MLQRICTRDRDGEIFGPDHYNETLESALSLFVIYELGYGGRIRDIKVSENEASVTVETNVMSCIDTMVLKGSLEEMDMILRIAVLAAKYHGMAEATIDQVADKVIKFTGGSPLLIKLSSGIIAGQQTLKNIVIHGFGLGDKLDKVSKLRTQDLVTIALMTHNKECTIDEAIELAL